MSAGGGFAARESHDSCYQCSFNGMPAATPVDDAAVRAALSAARSATYVTAAGGDTVRAMQLYGWNARISAAFMLPAHFAEVTTRNAADDVLTAVYGPDWPWDTSFTGSLPSPQRGYRPREDLVLTRGRQQTTGKVIAELKFAFWQSLFTARHDNRLWAPHIASIFPYATAMPAASLRSRVYIDLDAIRLLRNRIAHHEPVITRNLLDDLNRLIDLVELRSQSTATWVRALEDVTQTIAERP